jgi:hypothetical protein
MTDPWMLYTSNGHTTPCADHDDWLAEWRRRVRDIEFGDGTPQQRRKVLDRLMAANAPVFRAVIQHGSSSVALDATEAVILADMRLSDAEVAA